jgi:hypothetical protein
MPVQEMYDSVRAGEIVLLGDITNFSLLLLTNPPLFLQASRTRKLLRPPLSVTSQHRTETQEQVLSIFREEEATSLEHYRDSLPGATPTPSNTADVCDALATSAATKSLQTILL